MKERIRKALTWGKENKIKAKLIVLLVLIGVFLLTILLSKLIHKQNPCGSLGCENYLFLK